MILLKVIFLLLPAVVYCQENNKNNTSDSFDVNVSSSYGIQAQLSSTPNTTIIYPSNIQQIQQMQDRSGKAEKHEDQISQPTQFVDNTVYEVHENGGDDSDPVHFLPTPQAYTSYSGPSHDNTNVDNKQSASFPRPGLTEIQTVLNSVNDHNEINLSKVPKHAKIVEVVRVPAVYELHLESDANRLIKFNPWAKELMSQNPNFGEYINHQQFATSEEIPKAVPVPQYSGENKYNFGKPTPEVISTNQFENNAGIRHYGRGKIQYHRPVQHQETSHNHIPTFRGKKKYQPPANYNSQQQLSKNYGQQQNFGQQNSGGKHFAHQTRGSSPYSNFYPQKTYQQQKSAPLTGEIDYQYYSKDNSNLKNHQMVEEAKYTPYFAHNGKNPIQNTKNYGFQVSPEKNYGNHQVSSGYEVFAASNSVPQLSSDNKSANIKNYNYHQQSDALNAFQIPNKLTKPISKWKNSAQDYVYEKPNFQSVQTDHKYKKIIPTYTQPKEIPHPNPEINYKIGQDYEQSVQNLQYAYPKTKKSSEELINSNYKTQWNPEYSSEYLGDNYKKPQAIHEVPAPIFNGPSHYDAQNVPAPKVIYGKHTEFGPFKPKEYENSKKFWHPESAKEVNYAEHSLENSKNNHFQYQSYNKGIVDSVPNDFHSTLQTPTEQFTEKSVKTEVKYENQNNDQIIYDSAKPKVNYNRDVYIEEIPTNESNPANENEVQIIFAQNPSTETPSYVDIDTGLQNQQKFERNEQHPENHLDSQTIKYTNVDFPQPFQANKNRRSSTPAPLSPPQINYVLLIKERDIDD